MQREESVAANGRALTLAATKPTFGSAAGAGPSGSYERHGIGAWRSSSQVRLPGPLEIESLLKTEWTRANLMADPNPETSVTAPHANSWVDPEKTDGGALP